MFGEKLIIGHATVKLDSKRRIFIPSFSRAESGDDVVIRKSSYDNDFCLKIQAFQSYLDIIGRLRNLRDNAASIDEYEKFESKIESICIELEKLANVDGQGRILIPESITAADGWNIGDSLQIDGLGDSLLVRKKK